MQRIVVVSNRLPYTVAQEEGEWRFKESVGGLATGLSAYLDSLKQRSGNEEYLWVGWPGSTVPPEVKGHVKATSLEKYHSSPVFLTLEEIEDFYQGFCN